jgi:hypothetical protein
MLWYLIGKGLQDLMTILRHNAIRYLPWYFVFLFGGSIDIVNYSCVICAPLFLRLTIFVHQYSFLGWICFTIFEFVNLDISLCGSVCSLIPFLKTSSYWCPCAGSYAMMFFVCDGLCLWWNLMILLKYALFKWYFQTVATNTIGATLPACP